MVSLMAENEAAVYIPTAPLASIEDVTRKISPEALQCYAEGVSLSDQGKHEQAVEAYEKSLQRDRQNPQAWYNLGTTLGYLAQYTESLQALEQAIRLKDDYFEAWHNKGVALGRLQELEEALTNFEKALTLRPTDSQSWLSKGIISLAQHDFNKAIIALEKAQIAHESNPQIWMFKGVALGCLAKFAEAQLAFQNSFSIKHGPPDEGVYLYKAWATSTLAWGLNALLSNDVSAFENAGNLYLDVLDKAKSEDADGFVDDALEQLREKLHRTKQRKALRAFEELELYINLMKIKDPFEGWRALGEAMSERWPKGLSAVKAVREMRR